MGLVGDPTKVVPADGTGLAVPAVHREVVPDLRRQTARASPLRLQRLAQHAAHGLEQRRPLVRFERAERLVRGQLRPVQDVVRVPPADPRDRPLVAKDRVHATPVVPFEHEPLELGRIGFGPELGERALVAVGQHPPSGLALASELLHEQGRPVVEPEPDHRAARLRRLRRVLHVDPPRLRQVHEDPGPAELEHEVFPAPADPVERSADELGCSRRHGLQRGELQHVGRTETGAADGVREPLGERLHLRELGHDQTSSAWSSTTRPWNSASRS